MNFKEDDEGTGGTLKIHLKTETRQEETANLVMNVGESDAIHGDDAIRDKIHMHMNCLRVKWMKAFKMGGA
ncbi:hypothetical protein ACHAW6_006704 [Cyclotella cf. meneghiniana]